MNERRHTIALGAISLVEDTLFGEIQGHAAATAACKEGCQYMHKRSLGFVRQLRASNLYPMSQFEAMSLSDICASMRNFQTWEPSISSPLSCGIGAPCYKNKSTHAVSSRLQKFKSKADEIEHQVLRVCLECVKSRCWEGLTKCQKGHKVWI